MILVWNDTNAFREHLEDMRQFRQSHDSFMAMSLKALKNLPVQYAVKPPSETGLIKSLTNNKGNLIIVPIWKVNPVKGSQN